jgi:hypothetical protein
MKTFKEFAQIDELKTALPKAGSEKKFVQSTYLAQVKDPGDLEKVGPEEEGPHDTKKSAGKRPADRLDNKQAFGEADMSKQQTKMAHTIGKEFAKKKVGDGTKDAAYAIATSMVKDKPEAAKKAYATIKSKTQNEEHQDALMALFDELNESNQQMFMQKLEQNVDKLIEFATSRHEV